MPDEPRRQQCDLMIDKRDARIAEFSKYGITAEIGRYLGALNFSATELDKILKLLRKRKP